MADLTSQDLTEILAATADIVGEKLGTPWTCHQVNPGEVHLGNDEGVLLGVRYVKDYAEWTIRAVRPQEIEESVWRDALNRAWPGAPWSRPMSALRPRTQMAAELARVCRQLVVPLEIALRYAREETTRIERDAAAQRDTMLALADLLPATVWNDIRGEWAAIDGRIVFHEGRGNATVSADGSEVRLELPHLSSDTAAAIVALLASRTG